MQAPSKRLTRLIPKLNRLSGNQYYYHKPTTTMALFPRMSSFHTPTRSTHRDDLNPFFSLLNDTFSELQRLSDNLPTDSSNSTGLFAPKFDVKETSGAYELQGELPGVTHENLAIEFADEHTLTVKGRTEHSREQGRNPTTAHQKQQDAKDSAEIAPAATPSAPPEHTYWVSERSVGEFSRTFSFPHRVDQDGATASLKSGILSVVVPKLPKQGATRRITVETE